MKEREKREKIFVQVKGVSGIYHHTSACVSAHVLASHPPSSPLLPLPQDQIGLVDSTPSGNSLLLFARKTTLPSCVFLDNG
mmetsp:Transcript_9878/g.19158  ORF Transcript_9878/g.19158 Transcript_9878/m.19158 type:complete len:81 (+) Transcript_9878:812-1054(+)